MPDALRPAYPHGMKNRRVLGIIIGVVGAVLLALALLADQIGLSSGAPANSFGQRQMLAAGIGLLLVIAGGVIAFLRRS